MTLVLIHWVVGIAFIVVWTMVGRILVRHH